MKRRTFLTTLATAAAASSLPAPAIAQSIREIKLVSSFPKAPRVEIIGKTITEASGGRLRVRTYPSGELVGAFEVFDAVAEGIAEMYVASEYYWRDRSPAFNFFAGVPFGLTAIETYAWLFEGGGQQLWDELSASFNLKPFPSDVSVNQMGGWYNKEIATAADFEGLRIRIPGLGGELMRRLGAIVVDLPADDIVPALRSGALDAAEWVGPIQDFGLGLHTVAKNYYYPGIHEPGNVQSMGVNKTFWDSLSGEEQKLIETAVTASHTYAISFLHVQQIRTLSVLTQEHGVKLRKFDDEVLRQFRKVSDEVIAEVGSSDPFTRRVYENYMRFLRDSRDWTDVSDRAYLNARAL